MADTSTGRLQQQGTGSITFSFYGNSPGPNAAAAQPRLMSASISGPFSSSSAHRAKSTAPELIAEVYGRRLHGLDLLSTRKLNALNANAAKLEAQVASRTAAINLRTSVAAGPAAAAASAGAGAATPGTPHSSNTVTVTTSAVGSGASPAAGMGNPHVNGAHGSPRGTGSGAGGVAGGGSGGAEAVEAGRGPHGHDRGSGLGGGGGGGGTVVPDPLATAAAAMGDWQQLDNIAERGASIVKLLAMQDRVLHGALQAQAQSQQLSTSLSSPGGSRFHLSLSNPWEGGGGALSEKEQRQQDQVSIRHSSKVAAATVKLYRLSPRDPPGPELSEPPPTTPPNSERSNPLAPLPLLTIEPAVDEEGLGPELSGFMADRCPGSPARTLGRSKEFQTMARFVQSLQRGDEESLIEQARTFANYGSLSLDALGDANRSASAPLAALPALSLSLPLSPGGRAAAVAPAASAAAAGMDEGPGGGGGVEPTTPKVQIIAPEDERGEEGGGGGRSAGGSPRSRNLAPHGEWSMGRSMQLDLSAISTGQPRSRDILDGLIRAVELFVEGAGPPGERHGQDPERGEGEDEDGVGADGAAEGYKAQSPFEVYASAVAKAAEAEVGPQGDETPFFGVYGSPERLSERVRKKGALAVLSNPAGFREEVAAGEVAMYREMATRCRTALAQTIRYPQDSLAASGLLKQVVGLHHCRPYFVAPRETLPEAVLPLRPPSSRGMSRQTTTFLVQSVSADSVFLQRAVDSEGEDIIDPLIIRERQVRKDWNRVVRKDTFRALVGGDDPGVISGTAGLGHSLDALLAVIVRHRDAMRAAFTYYSMMGISISDYCFAVNLNSWRTFVFDCGLSNGGPPPATAATTPAGLRGGPQSSLQLQLPGAGGAGTAAAAAAGAGDWGGRGTGTRSVSAQRQSMAGLPPAAAAAAGQLAATAAGASRMRLPSATSIATGGGGAFGAGAGGGRGSDRQLLLPAAPSGQPLPPTFGSHYGRGGAGGLSQPHQPADAVFQAVHGGAEKRVLEGKVNTDRTLLRFEWYEALIRLATVRHIKGGMKCGSIAAALEYLWVYDILPALPHAAVHEPNKWRVNRLFGDPQVNQLFIKHMDVLMALYDCLTCARQPRLMHLSDWIGLLNSFRLIGDVTGLTLHAAKLSYCRSLCIVVDEMARWSRAVCADSCDFLEALARLAEEMAPPPVEEVAEALRDVGLYGKELRAALVHPWLMYYTVVPPDMLTARRVAAAEAAAARSTSTGEDFPAALLPHTPISPAALAALAGPAGVAAASSPTRPGARGGVTVLLPPVTAAGSGVPAVGPASPLPAPPPDPLAAEPPPPSAQPSSTSTSSSSALPPLSLQLGALLDLLLGRLRQMWGVADDRQLAERLKAAAAAGKHTMPPLPPPLAPSPGG